MTLGNSSESALAAFNKRKAQLDRWNQSETEKEATEIRNRPKRVKFADKCIFQAACASNDKSQVARMIRDGYNINTVDEDGITALHQACIEDNFEMVEFLLAHGADVNISDNEGWTPLHAVATCCYTSIAKLLLEHDANIVALNNDCNIPLDICNSDDIREFFKEDIAAKGIDLVEARRGEELRMMEDAKKWLVNGHYGEEPHPTTGATAMHVAACKGYIKVLDQLIKAGADINAYDFDGWTPLHAAAHWGQKEACRVLLESGCDINLTNNCDQTALDVADLNVVSILEDSKSKCEMKQSEPIVGKLNLLPLPPKKKNSRPVLNENAGGHLRKGAEFMDSSSDGEEDFVGSEADDIVGDLPSSVEHVENTTTKLNISTDSILASDWVKSCNDAQDENICSFEPNLHSTAIFMKPRDLNATSNTAMGDSIRGTKMSDTAKVVTSIPSVPTPSASIGSSGVVPKAEPLKVETGGSGDSDETVPAWRRSGSLRTRTPNSAVPEEDTTPNDKAAVRRTRSEASPDVSLRRAFSFESDAKFYSRLVTARNRIKAIEAASAAMTANLLDVASLNTANIRVTSSTPTTKCSTIPSSTLTSFPTTSNEKSRLISSEDNLCKSLNKTHNAASADHNPEVVLRRKETAVLDSTRLARPTTISTTSLPNRPVITNSNIVQMRSGGDGGGTTPTSPSSAGGAKTGPVSKFKQFLIKSFVPPARDEESETQRKVHAKRVRETRRSTQGVTLEELKSAEQYVKAQQTNAQTSNEQNNEVPTTVAVPGTTPSATAVGALRKDEDSLERRPSWRLRVDDSDRSKFSLEDLRTTSRGTDVIGRGDTERSEIVTQRSPNLRSRRNEFSNNRPPRPPEENDEKITVTTDDKDLKSSGAQAVIAKKKRPKRRSTGVVSYTADESEGLDEPRSDTEGSGKGSDPETGPESPKSENGLVTRVNYRKLYEETLKENQQLKSRISGLEEQVTELKLKVDRAALAPRIGSDTLDKREKRALEQKFREMEEELKSARSLAADNQKLRDENGALIRVISKLSK